MEMFMVKMFEGKEEQHHTARAEFIALTRNLNDVIGVYTFEVDQEILEPSDPFYYDSTNNEIMMGQTTEHGEMRTPRMAPPVVHGFTSDPEKRK